MTIKLELDDTEISFILEALLARSLNRADGNGITSEILQKIDSNGNCTWITTDCLADQNLTKENKSCKNMKI